MKTAILVLKDANIIQSVKGDYIGVDQGALQIIKQGLPLSTAIGDFDSITVDEKAYIEKNTTNFIALNPMKDTSDTQEAIILAEKLGYKKIVVMGGLSKRFDHTWANMQLLRKYPHVVWMDDHNKIQILSQGESTIEKENYHYISFFALKSGIITIENLKYQLKQYALDELDSLCLSNEFNDKQASIITTMPVLCIQSKD